MHNIKYKFNPKIKEFLTLKFKVQTHIDFFKLFDLKVCLTQQ